MEFVSLVFFPESTFTLCKKETSIQLQERFFRYWIGYVQEKRLNKPDISPVQKVCCYVEFKFCNSSTRIACSYFVLILSFSIIIIFFCYHQLFHISGGSKNIRGQVTFSKIGTKISKIFVCRGYANIKTSHVLVR